MQQFTIKTYSIGSMYEKPHFFILNRGLNCGKPLTEPCPNCFVLQCENDSKRESYFWMAQALWQSRYWHRFLIGSVIPFFRLDEFTNEFSRKCDRMLLDHARHQNQVKVLRLLQERETHHHENAKQIKQLRNIILAGYLKE